MTDLLLLEFLTFYEFLVALLMGFAALCFFVWGIITGNFKNVEVIKYKVCEVEANNEEE
jgi:cbb3-type cytochrome oxidase maturation protein